MRCIDADALIDKYGEWYTEEGTEEGYIGTIKGIVDSMPTIEGRKTGEWLHDLLQDAIDAGIITETQGSRLMDMINDSEDNT